MHTYDNYTKHGIHIHLSVSKDNTCYILVRDVYDHEIIIKFFTDTESAKEFIKSL